MTDKDLQFDFDEIINRCDFPVLKTHPMMLGDKGNNLFAAGVADMDFRPSPVVIKAMQARLDHGVFGYETVPEGLIPALTGWFAQRHGWELNPQHILRSPNILNALAMAVSLFTGKGDGVIVQPPVFFDFFDVISENSRVVVENPLILEDGRYSMDFEDLERKAADPRCRMLFLCNPHNPVGRVWDSSELEMLGTICARHEVMVVSDEIHCDLLYNPHKYTSFSALENDCSKNSIICISPAKTFNLASCCSSFTIIQNDNTREIFSSGNSRLTVNKNNAFASAAMEAAYGSGGPWLDAVLAYLAQNKALVSERLKGMEWVELIEAEGTFLLWLDFRKTGMIPSKLSRFLKEKASWAVTRGEAFGKQGEGFARLNIACPRALLEAALERLESAMDNFQSSSR
jgi:cystathionine beta-lyase